MRRDCMYIDEIKTVALTDVWEFYNSLQTELLSPIQEVHFGNDNEQAIYVGKLIYGLEAAKDLTFTKINGKVQLMDGAKRLNAVLRFVASQISVGGKSFKDFDLEQLKKIKLLITVVGRDI